MKKEEKDQVINQENIKSLNKNIEEKKINKSDKEQQKTNKFQPLPQADEELSSKILMLLNQALRYKQVKKGINETIKNINKDQVECVILASDADPIELLSHLPIICDEKSIPYCFIPQSSHLGRACGITRPVIACCLIESEKSGMQDQINILKDKIEMLFYSQLIFFDNNKQNE